MQTIRHPCSNNPLHEAGVVQYRDAEGNWHWICRDCYEARRGFDERRLAELEALRLLAEVGQDPIEKKLRDYLRTKNVTTTHEVLEHFGERVTRRNEIRIGKLLRLRLRWVRARRWTPEEVARPEMRGGHKVPRSRYFEPRFFARLDNWTGKLFDEDER